MRKRGNECEKRQDFILNLFLSGIVQSVMFKILNQDFKIQLVNDSGIK